MQPENSKIKFTKKDAILSLWKLSMAVQRKLMLDDMGHHFLSSHWPYPSQSQFLGVFL
jgi:hypothetical protein